MKCIKAAKRPHPQAVEVERGVWAVPDDAAAVGVAAVASDVARRPECANQRVVRNVPSGWPDATIVDGKLMPVGADFKPIPESVVIPDVAADRVP